VDVIPSNGSESCGSCKHGIYPIFFDDSPESSSVWGSHWLSFE
jgi:hypothetical protein